MELTQFKSEYLPEATTLFLDNFKKLRQSVPSTPSDFEDASLVARKLDEIMRCCPGVAAIERGRLIGYLGWWVIDNFRGTKRKAAYVPEWGHATVHLGMDESRPGIYRAMYRAAAAHWVASGCQTHAISILASDKVAERTWYWSGFGLTVIDAVRPVQPIGIKLPDNLILRKATLDDVQGLADIESEHWHHYAQPPTLMVPQPPDGIEAFTNLLNTPQNSVWLAIDKNNLAAYLRIESENFGASQIVRSKSSFAITGAYTRPVYRGLGAAPALLDSALREYASRGYDCCSVDFESLNPEAAAFWMKYFHPVCYSLIRIPETSL